MPIRVGRFKRNSVAGYHYVRGLTYSALADCHKTVLACSSYRRLSQLELERPSIHPALLSGDPSQWEWRESYAQSATSHYRDLITNFSKTLNATVNEVEVEPASANSSCKYNTELNTKSVDTLSCTESSDFISKLGYQAGIVSCPVNSRGKLDNIDQYSIHTNYAVQNSSQAELKSEVVLEHRFESSGDDKEPKKNKPDQLDLERIKDFYIDSIPYLYKSNEDFSRGLHHPDLVFENNYFPKQTVLKGLHAYAQHLHWLRLKATFRFYSYFFQAVGATIHLDEGCVKLHWRFYYVGNIEFYTKYLFRRMQRKPTMECYNTTDAISTFYVNKDGQVTKHQVDRLMPIQKSEVLKPRMTSNLGVMMGLASPAPKASFETATSKFKKKAEPQG